MGGVDLISAYWTAVLASAYELAESQVVEDAARVGDWGGLDDELILALEQRHAWMPASEYGLNYLADLRVGLE